MNPDEAIKKVLEVTRNNMNESVHEYFENIEAIKGKDYMDAVKFIAGVAHTAKLISVGTQAAPDQVKEAVGLQFAQVAAGGATLITRLLKLTDEQVHEALEISERISETIDNQLEQVSKTIRDIRKESGNE